MDYVWQIINMLLLFGIGIFIFKKVKKTRAKQEK